MAELSVRREKWDSYKKKKSARGDGLYSSVKNEERSRQKTKHSSYQLMEASVPADLLVFPPWNLRHYWPRSARSKQNPTQFFFGRGFFVHLSLAAAVGFNSVRPLCDMIIIIDEVKYISRLNYICMSRLSYKVCECFKRKRI